MSLHPPRLSDRRAPMRPAAPSGAARRMLPISLHAIIAAIFARIFARLEQILALWQAGTLPLPPARKSAPTHRTPAINNRAPRRRTTRAPRVRARQNCVRIRAAVHTPGKLAASTPASALSPPSRHAHDPPGRLKNPIFD